MLYTDTVKLKKIMLDKGIEKRVELSRKSGIGRDTLGRILNGDIQPSSAAMEKLIVALQISQVDAGEIFFNCSLLNMQEKTQNKD